MLIIPAWAPSSLADEQSQAETVGNVQKHNAEEATRNEQLDGPPNSSMRSDTSLGYSRIELGTTDIEQKEKTQPGRRKGRIKELEEIKGQLAQKELELLSKENVLLQQKQDIEVLRQELEIEKTLRALITKEKEDAEEEAALAMGLCTGSTMLP